MILWPPSFSIATGSIDCKSRMRRSTFFVLLLAAARMALALDPALAITQFVHTSWTERDGAPNNVRALAQTRDGYLWMGTTAACFGSTAFASRPLSLQREKLCRRRESWDCLRLATARFGLFGPQDL